MPEYLYACDEPEHERWRVTHSMTKNVHVICPKCHKYMHRVPQAFKFYMNPGQVLLDKLSERFEDVKRSQKYGTKRKYARGDSI